MVAWERKMAASLGGLSTFFSHVVTFLEEAEQQYGVANENFTEYVLEQLELCIRSCSRLGGHLTYDWPIRVSFWQRDSRVPVVLARVADLSTRALQKVARVQINLGLDYGLNWRWTASSLPSRNNCNRPWSSTI